MKDIILIGGGGHCQSVIDIIEQGQEYRIAGIVDVADRLGDKVLGYSVIASDQQLPELAKTYRYALVTTGQIHSAQLRQTLYEQARCCGFNFPVLKSPRAYVSPHADIAPGTVVGHDALVHAACRIGENCIINSKALIEHNSRIGAHCHIATGAIINGDVRIGARSFVGSGAVVVNQVVLQAESFIKAGRLVKTGQ